MKIKLVIHLLLLISLSSCKFSNEQYESKVLDDIFLDLLIEMSVQGVLLPPPPPLPLDFLDTNYDTTGYAHKVAKYEEDILLEKERLVKEFQDYGNRPKEMILAIADSMSTMASLNNSMLEKVFPTEVLSELVESIEQGIKKKRKLQIKEITSTGPYQLKYFKDLPRNINYDDKKLDLKYVGSIGISRIYFDKVREHGILGCSYTMGALSGHGALICIKKVKNRWIIIKSIVTWVS